MTVGTRTKWSRGRIALILIVVAALVGGVGGAWAGYHAEWDPRLYWYSATRKTGVQDRWSKEDVGAT